MDMGKKAAYLKGLIDGLGLDESTKEGKVIALMADILQDAALLIEDLQEQIDEVVEVVDIIDKDLGELEEDFYDEDYDDWDEEDWDDDDWDDDWDEDDWDDEDWDDEEYDFIEDDLYEITCPNCEDTVYLDESMIEDGSINCPNCGELLEFDFDLSDLEESDNGKSEDKS